MIDEESFLTGHPSLEGDAARQGNNPEVYMEGADYFGQDASASCDALKVLGDQSPETKIRPRYIQTNCFIFKAITGTYAQPQVTTGDLGILQHYCLRRADRNRSVERKSQARWYRCGALILALSGTANSMVNKVLRVTRPFMEAYSSGIVLHARVALSNLTYTSADGTRFLVPAVQQWRELRRL
jgi:hypothetical protein